MAFLQFNNPRFLWSRRISIPVTDWGGMVVCSEGGCFLTPNNRLVSIGWGMILSHELRWSSRKTGAAWSSLSRERGADLGIHWNWPRHGSYGPITLKWSKDELWSSLKSACAQTDRWKTNQIKTQDNFDHASIKKQKEHQESNKKKNKSINRWLSMIIDDHQKVVFPLHSAMTDRWWR